MNDYYEKYKDVPEMLVARADREGNLELLKEIFIDEKKLDILSVSQKERWNSLHSALLLCEVDHPKKEVIQFYIDNGVDINAQDIYGMTPLHYAMRGKNVDAAIALLNAGADPNIEDIDTSTPLAYINGMPKELALLSLMLEKGGNVHHFNGQHGILEGIKKYRINNPDFKPVIELMEKYA
ncbi:ankyrin repeat domain-containing protein [Rodentibacter pneumotropicus]|uniref:ankyrin repeat domain-containing protein n=1 Tax=Rodentibacter pneumotropicus TaxID=758 RepID=UPI00109C3CF3|nr:ankyrin repeat domain-containing protein [Rodentibacter pneumotropicus]THA02382.1 ankyrin repeat domain-containing protein [Rodentibacter pneumotropicus]